MNEREEAEFWAGDSWDDPPEPPTQQQLDQWRDDIDDRWPFLKGKWFRGAPRARTGPRDMRYNIPPDRFHGYIDPVSEADTRPPTADPVLAVLRDIREMMRRQPPRYAPPSTPSTPVQSKALTDQYKAEFDA